MSKSSQEVRTLIANFVNVLDDRNTSGLLTFYTNSSIVRWSGNSGFQDGTYEGANDGIKLLYHVFTSDVSSIHATVSNLTTNVIASETVNATFGLYLREDGPITGPRNATVSVLQLWTNLGGTWYIQKEKWNYLTLTGTPIA